MRWSGSVLPLCVSSRPPTPSTVSFSAEPSVPQDSEMMRSISRTSCVLAFAPLIPPLKMSWRALMTSRSRVTAGEWEAVTLDREVNNAGFSVGIGNANALLCISALQDIFRGGINGAKANTHEVREMLRIISESWGTEGSALKETVLGVGGLLLTHNGNTDPDHLIKALQVLPGGPNAIRARAKYHRENTGRPIRETAVTAVREAYNKKLHASKKLVA